MKLAPKLTDSERADLDKHMSAIKRGFATFYDVGSRLADISDRRLYRENYPTFQEFCMAEFNISARRAYQLCEAAEVVKSLPENVNHGSQINERQARELAKVEPCNRVEVIEAAKAKAESEERPMTARHIKTADEELKQALGGAVPEILEDPEQNYTDFLHRFDEAFQAANKLTGNNRTKASHEFATAPAKLRKAA